MTDQLVQTGSGMNPKAAPRVELAAGPLLFALGLAVTWFGQEVGPLDRAAVQGLFGLPLMAIGPGVASLAGRTPEVRSQVRLAIGGTAAALGILAMMATGISVTVVRCRPVTNPVDVLAEAVVVGLLATVTYGVAGAVALASAARGRRWTAIAAGAGTFAGLTVVSVLVAFTVLFPPLSCVPPQ